MGDSSCSSSSGRRQTTGRLEPAMKGNLQFSDQRASIFRPVSKV